MTGKLLDISPSPPLVLLGGTGTVKVINPVSSQQRCLLCHKLGAETQFLVPSSPSLPRRPRAMGWGDSKLYRILIGLDPGSLI